MILERKDVHLKRRDGTLKNKSVTTRRHQDVRVFKDDLFDVKKGVLL